MHQPLLFEKRPFFTYYLGLFDMEKSTFDGIRRTRQPVPRVISGIHDYFPLFTYNFTVRGNWYLLTLEEIEKGYPVDFCITNHPKISFKSRFSYRVLLDTPTYFISDKSEFYETFKDQSFVPEFVRTTIKNNKLVAPSNFDESDWVVLKPDNGCLGLNILVNRYGTLLNKNYSDIYKNSTITKLYISKQYQGHVLSNRIYFLIIKRGNVIESYVYDEFVNYRAAQPFTGTDSDFLNYQDTIISNYANDTCTDEEFFNNRYVSHSNYVSLFTKEEFLKIQKTLHEHLIIITKKISPHALSNDGAASFHLYGIDTIIDDNNNIKIIEINGAPSMTDRTYLYPKTECTNYNFLVNALLEVLVDKECSSRKIPNKIGYGKYKDSIDEEKLFESKFVLLTREEISPPPKRFYIPKSIDEKYPFIAKGFFSEMRTPFYQRVKNPYNSIDVFYGLRDLYVNSHSSDNYYNEIVEYNLSECSRNARIVNKIQGVTYFLANKARMYSRLKEKYSADYHPPSIIVKVKDKKIYSKSSRQIITSLSELKDCSTIIIKPSNGSQGKGISILKFGKISVLKRLFEIHEEFGYDSFVISKYIDNPYLVNGKKFNIRFYVLLFLENDELKCFLLRNKIVYYSVSKYSRLDDNLQNLSFNDKIMVRNITNLRCITNLNEKYGLKLKLEDYVDYYDNLSVNHNNINSQFLVICRDTINATKNEFRGINRFVKSNACFNLVAYDTLLDETGKLHLIEVNRGADLVGLEIIMKEKLIEVFTEIFDICVDGREELSYFENVEL